MSHGHKKEVLVEGNQTFHSVTEKIAGIVEMKNSKAWLVGFGISGFFATVLLVSIVYLLWEDYYASAHQKTAAYTTLSAP